MYLRNFSYWEEKSLMNKIFRFNNRSSCTKPGSPRKYEAFTLIEMIVTILIMMVIMMMVAVTLNAMIRASLRSDVKLRVRDEVDTSLEIMKRFLSQADADEVRIYQSESIRSMNPGSMTIETSSTANLQQVYSSSAASGAANEIHILPPGGDRYICFGYFKVPQSYSPPNDFSPQPEQGFLVKTSYAVDNGYSPELCFDSSKADYKKNVIILNSDTINFADFILNFNSAGGENTYFDVKIGGKSNKWYGEDEQSLYYKQIAVSTGKLSIE
ncbi:hypothetical protein GF357_02285 [Candidatus Dojkabacteria bacterium]|nr:hypothetical protein [Candidatus Dojkabacteria bacterium]